MPCELLLDHKLTHCFFSTLSPESLRLELRFSLGQDCQDVSPDLLKSVDVQQGTAQTCKQISSDLCFCLLCEANVWVTFFIVRSPYFKIETESQCKVTI